MGRERKKLISPLYEDNITLNNSGQTVQENRQIFQMNINEKIEIKH